MSMQSAALSLPPMKEAAAPAAPPNAPHDDVEYHSLWRGLRVRVGIHCGYGEIRKDPTTQGYDYFGTIVNTAARVEGVGHGGQTLVTAELCQRLGEGFVVGSGWAQVSLGPQSLRGLDEKVVLMQLLPTTLAGRRFPALRLDVEVIVSCSDGTGAKTLASASNGTVTAQGVEAMAVALCAETFRVNRAAKRQPGRGGDGEQSQSGTHVSQVSAVHNPVARANVVELLYQYHFLTSLFATSSEGWRRDAVRHLGWGALAGEGEGRAYGGDALPHTAAGGAQGDARPAGRGGAGAGRRHSCGCGWPVRLPIGCRCSYDF